MQSVRVTYANRKRRSRKATRRLLSSPLQPLPVDVDDITCSQMAHRMLKRSRRVALMDQFEDQNTQILRDKISKRSKHGEDVLNLETPFPSPPAHEMAAANPSAPERLSPVPARKHLHTTPKRSTEKDLMVYSDETFPLDSPFNSHPGSANPSPKYKGRGCLPHRTLRYMRPRIKHKDIDRTSNTRFHTSDGFDVFPLPWDDPQTSFYISTPAIPCHRKARSNIRGCGIQLSASDTSAGAFIAEYETPLSEPKHSVGVRPFSFPGSSPACGDALFFSRRRRSGILSPPVMERKACPPSPASDLVHELWSMDISGDLDTELDRGACCSPLPIPLLMHANRVRDGLSDAKPSMKKALKGVTARNRAGTIRASDFVKPGTSSRGGHSISLSNMRRARSGTVVGPDSKLVAKGVSTGLAAVRSESESESDDELLLKARWVEDTIHLGHLTVPPKDAEVDELNLGGRSAFLPGSRRQ